MRETIPAREDSFTKVRWGKLSDAKMFTLCGILWNYRSLISTSVIACNARTKPLRSSSTKHRIESLKVKSLLPWQERATWHRLLRDARRAELKTT
jgi:hypothetical protein